MEWPFPHLVIVIVIASARVTVTTATATATAAARTGALGVASTSFAMRTGAATAGMDFNRWTVRNLHGTQSEIEIKLIDFGYFRVRDFDLHGFSPLL
jgi:hypothetical protein